MCEVDRHWMRLPLEEIARTSRMGNRGFIFGFVVCGVVFLNGMTMQDSREASEHHRSTEFAPQLHRYFIHKANYEFQLLLLPTDLKQWHMNKDGWNRGLVCPSYSSVPLR